MYLCRMATILTFMDTEIWGNTLRQYAWLLGVILVVIIFNKYISNFISRLLFQLLKRSRFKHSGQLFLKLLLQPLEFILVLHTIYIGFQMLDAPEFFQFKFIGATLHQYAYGLYTLLFIVSTGWLFSRFADFIITVMNEKAQLTPDPSDDQVVSFLKDVFKVVIWTTVVLCVLAFVFHVNVTSLVAGAGIAGIAIAFAAQETLQNIFGSISLFAEKPFLVGDLVELDGITGTVDKVGFRSTRLRALDKSFQTIPNRNIVSNRIINLSRRTSRRVQFLLGLEYGTKAEAITAIVSEIDAYTTQHPVTNEPSVVHFYGFGASSLDIWVEIYFEYLEWDDFLRKRQEIMLGIMDIVEKHGGSFAFPSQTLYMRQDVPKEPTKKSADISSDIHHPKGE